MDTFCLVFGGIGRCVFSLSYSGIQAFRQCADRFSNGDENEVSIRVESSYTYPVSLEVIDEIPVVFQKRDVDFRTKLQANEGKTITYRLRPTRRGVYSFGYVRVL